MSRSVAFLRGINTGGHRVAMTELRKQFETLGLKNVETYIASGNVIFDTPKGATPALEKKIEQHLAKALGFPTPACVRTLAEIEAVAGHKAFPKVAEDDSLWIYLLREKPDKAMLAALGGMGSEVEAFHANGREIYWLCHGKMSEVSRVWPKLEKLMKSVEATARNIRTLEKIVGLYKT
ncbi:MAG TPA: DUF1697 domain-containing protein [Opitutaceae bacterium]